MIDVGGGHFKGSNGGGASEGHNSSNSKDNLHDKWKKAEWTTSLRRSGKNNDSLSQEPPSERNFRSHFDFHTSFRSAKRSYFHVKHFDRWELEHGRPPRVGVIFSFPWESFLGCPVGHTGRPCGRTYRCKRHSVSLLSSRLHHHIIRRPSTTKVQSDIR